MINKIDKVFIVFICFWLTVFQASCSFGEAEIVGLYTPDNYINTFDTIQIQPQGRYHRRVYDKSGRLALEMDGKWSIKNDVINFESPYFFNLDRDILQFPELLNDTVSNGGGYLDRKNGTILFCVGYHENQNCYQKLEK